MFSTLAEQVTNWEKLTAIATAVGGIGAMLGAIFAWLAARSSRDASRDAVDALAASLKPDVQLLITQFSERDPVVARAVVRGPLSPIGLASVAPAADVRIEFNLASGRHGESSIALLQANASAHGQLPPYLNVVIGDPSDTWPPPAGDRVTVTVSFSDVRGAARYQQSRSADLHRVTHDLCRSRTSRSRFENRIDSAAYAVACTSRRTTQPSELGPPPPSR